MKKKYFTEEERIEARKLDHKKWRDANKEKIKENGKKWREDNPEKKKEQTINWYLENPEYNKKWLEQNPEYNKERYANNINSEKQRKKDWAADNVEKIKEYTKKYVNPNPEKRRENKRKWNQLHHKKYPHIKSWRSVLSNCLRRMGKNKSGNTIDLLGYSAIELKKHIASLFTDGMSWDNYGEWHIDHIKMVCEFDKNTPMNVVNALSNLRPLWSTTRKINGVVYEGNLNRNRY